MRILFLLLLLILQNAALAQRLELFTSKTGRDGNPASAEKIPYRSTVTIFDFISEEQKPDSIVDGQPWFYYYFMLPFQVTEIGIRMISPVPGFVFANPGDIETEAYASNKSSKKYFNPWIAVEQALTSDSLMEKQHITSWVQLGKNSDSDEVIPQPQGKSVNSLLQIYSGPYTPGIYRIKYKSETKGIPEGTFLIETGFVPSVKRIKMSKSFQGLFEE